MHVFKEEDVGTLHISVQYLPYVKRPEASNDLNENVPDLFFFNVSFTLLVSANFLVNIAVISILHNKA